MCPPPIGECGLGGSQRRVFGPSSQTSQLGLLPLGGGLGEGPGHTGDHVSRLA